jgi:hypothetical protein
VVSGIVNIHEIMMESSRGDVKRGRSGEQKDVGSRGEMRCRNMNMRKEKL